MADGGRSLQSGSHYYSGQGSSSMVYMGGFILFVGIAIIPNAYACDETDVGFIHIGSLDLVKGLDDI